MRISDWSSDVCSSDLLLVGSAAVIGWDVPALKGFDYRGGIKIMPELAALIAALTLYNAAFVAEVVRAGIQSVGEGQRQAATALGLSPRLTMRLVIVPQAIRVMVPPMANQDRKSTRLNSSH